MCFYRPWWNVISMVSCFPWRILRILIVGWGEGFIKEGGGDGSFYQIYGFRAGVNSLGE